VNDERPSRRDREQRHRTSSGKERGGRDDEDHQRPRHRDDEDDEDFNWRRWRPDDDSEE